MKQVLILRQRFTGACLKVVNVQVKPEHEQLIKNLIRRNGYTTMVELDTNCAVSVYNKNTFKMLQGE